MRKLKVNRKARFKAALALAGMRVGDFALAAGVTRQHLGAVLRSERDSGTLVEKVDAFIKDVEDRVMVGAA